MKILGIDPGVKMGWAVLKPGKTHRDRFVACGVRDESKRKKRRYVIREHADFFRMIVDTHEINVIVIETVLGLRGGDAKRALGEYLGAFLLYAGELPVYGVHSSHWRKVVLGHGNADKAMAVRHVKEWYGIDQQDENACEALCVAEAMQLCVDITKFESY